MKSRVFLFLSLSIACLSVPRVEAAPLTRQALEDARRVGIFFGTFDPFTKGHRTILEDALKKADIDRIILLPVVTGRSKEPTAFATRIGLIDFELHDHPGILYPSEGEWRGLYEKTGDSDWFLILKSLIGDRKLDIILGEDAIAKPINQIRLFAGYSPDRILIFQRNGAPKPKLTFVPSARVRFFDSDEGTVSSSKVRAWFAEHPEVYFDPSAAFPEALKDMITPGMFSRIREAGIYLGYPATNTVSWMERVKRMLSEGVLRSIGLRAPIIDYRRSRLSRPDVREITVAGEKIPVERHLGNGFSGNAYLVTWKGKKAVIKIPIDGAAAREDILRNALVSRWIQENTDLPTPALYAVGANGEYMISEYIEGEAAREFLKKNGPTEAFLIGAEKLYRSGRALYERNGMVLDLNSGNFIVQDDRVVLVDLGLQTRGTPFFPSFPAALREWDAGDRTAHCRWLLGGR